MNRVCICIFLILTVLISMQCTTKFNVKTESPIYETSDFKTIQVLDKYDNYIQSDSLFEHIYAIPLETNENCLLNRPCKLLIQDEKIFIQDFNRALVVFDINGSYIGKIGRQGRGPGEYVEIADFQIDKYNGDIYIVDYHKLLKYSSSGQFLNSLPFNFNTRDFICYPEQIILSSNGGFFIWSGSNGIHNNSNIDNVFAMYEISNSGKIKNCYFPVKYRIQNDHFRFRRYKDTYLIDPVFGMNTIFCIRNDSVFRKYDIDFGKNNLIENIPNDLDGLADFKLNINKAYGIGDFTEIDEWIYFYFLYQNSYYHVYYSKLLNRKFIYRNSPKSIPQKSFVWKIDGTWQNNFVTLIEPRSIMEKLERINTMDRLDSSELELIQSLKNINEADNPILFIVEMKGY